jgi:hypothetical protein
MKGREEHVYRLALLARSKKHNIELAEAKGEASKRRHKRNGGKKQPQTTKAKTEEKDASKSAS